MSKPETRRLVEELEKTNAQLKADLEHCHTLLERCRKNLKLGENAGERSPERSSSSPVADASSR